MHIDKFKDGESGEYIDETECYWEDAESFLQGKSLNFCCCGHPMENLKYIGKVLRHIHNLKMLVWEEKCSYAKWVNEGKKIGSEQSLYFAYYFLDFIEFTEHGGSVPGWLTKEGIDFMEDIEELICKSPTS